MQTCRNKINGGDRVSYNYPTNVEIAEKIRKYVREQRGIIHIPPPEDYKTVSFKNLERASNMEKEWARAKGEKDDYSDDEADDDYYEGLGKCMN